MYERPQVTVKVEPRSTFTLTRESRESIHCLYFIYVGKVTRQWKSNFTETEVVAYNNRTSFCRRIYCLQFLNYTYTCNFVLTLHKFFVEHRSTYSEQQRIKWSPAYKRLEIVHGKQQKHLTKKWKLAGTKNVF